MKIIDNYLETLNEIDPITIGVTVGVANLLMAAGTAYKNNFTKGSRRCNDLPTKEKAICMLRVKLAAKKVQFRTIKTGLVKCNKSKNPEKCKEKISNKMNKLSDEINFIEQRFKEVRKQKY